MKRNRSRANESKHKKRSKTKFDNSFELLYESDENVYCGKLIMCANCDQIANGFIAMEKCNSCRKTVCFECFNYCEHKERFGSCSAVVCKSCLTECVYCNKQQCKQHICKCSCSTVGCHSCYSSISLGCCDIDNCKRMVCQHCIVSCIECQSRGCNECLKCNNQTNLCAWCQLNNYMELNIKMRLGSKKYTDIEICFAMADPNVDSSKL